VGAYLCSKVLLMIPLMFFDFIKGDALPLMRGTNVSGGWVQWYNVSTGEVGQL